jgi:hypothetical protein
MNPNPSNTALEQLNMWAYRTHTAIAHFRLADSMKQRRNHDDITRLLLLAQLEVDRFHANEFTTD